MKIEENDKFILLENPFISVNFDKVKRSLSILSNEISIRDLCPSYVIKVISQNSFDSENVRYEKKEEKYEFTMMDYFDFNLVVKPISDNFGLGSILELTTISPIPLYEKQIKHNLAFKTQIYIYEDKSYVFLKSSIKNIKVHNDNLQKVHLLELKPFSLRKEDSLLLGSMPSNWSFLKQGYQSWSPTGSFKSSEKEKSPLIPLSIIEVMSSNLSNKIISKEGRFISEWMGAIKDLGSGNGLIIGFIDFTKHFSSIHYCVSENKLNYLYAKADFEGIVLNEDNEIETGRLMVLLSKNPSFDLEKWANCTSIEMNARKNKTIPSGWCSWYHYFTSVSESDVISNLNWLKKHKEELKLDYVVIDDGYEKSVGDWLETNKKFPHGMKWIAEKIKEAGFKPGIWTAPFFAARNSSIYKKHKNWFIKDKFGKPVVAGISPAWKTILYALDCTNPEVQSFLNTTFRTLSEWGYEFFKIDFIYSGALSGERYVKNITRAMAYRMGLEIVRKAVGDKFILGCGAPLGTAVGIVDAMRISPDTAPRWDDKFAKFFLKLRSYPSALNSILNTLTRWYMNQNLWINDPDCLLVRHDKSSLKLKNIRMLATVYSLSGGMILDSDKLPSLTPGRINILKMLLPPSFIGNAVALDIFENYIPSQFLLMGNNGIFNVAFINVNPVKKNFSFSLQRSGMIGKYHAFNFWEERYLGLFNDKIEIKNVSPQSVEYIIFTPYEPGVPTLIAHTFYLIQNEIKTKFDVSTMSMNLEISFPGKREGRIYIFIPEDLIFEDCKGNNCLMPFWKVDRSILKFELSYKDWCEVNIKFRRRLLI